MSETLQLKSDVSSIPVKIELKGKVIEGELREMTAARRDQYLDTVSDRMRFDANGRPAGIKKFSGMQTDLLIRCLFITREGKETSVTEEEVKDWPSSIVADLFRHAQKLNRLGEEVPQKNG